MRKTFIVAILYTLVTPVLLGIAYPLVVTAIAEITMPNKANGQLLTQDGHVLGSAIMGQAFTSDRYFHSRPSAAGNGYDATSSGGSNLGPTNQKLLDRVKADTDRLQAENPAMPVPVDLVTTSGSGLDPDITLAGADFQIPRIARERKMSEDAVRQLIAKHTYGRQLGFLGEPRVNVVELNLDLDAASRK